MTEPSARIVCPACRQDFSPPAGAEVPCLCARCGSLVLGPCCDLKWIGGGSMGDVYRGRQVEMGNRTVAVKIPRSGENRRVTERFEREIFASARLNHENIVCAHSRGEQQGRPFLVMEFVAGRALREVVDAEHPLSPRRVAGILLDVARGLAHAEQQGIVNRDIKPDNIMLTSPPNETAKVLDYGLARIKDVDGTAFEVTRSGVLLGTPGYLAPEQAADPHNVTIAADVYSLGCTAFYCLTRQAPFAASTLDEMRRCHAEAERPSLAALRPDVPGEMERLVVAMMSVDAGQRPTPAQLVTRLTGLLPRLSADRPRPIQEFPTEIPPERIDVVCPSCGETYHVNAAAVGKRFVCRNKLCQHRFTIESPVVEALVAEAVEVPAEAIAIPAEAGEIPPLAQEMAAEAIAEPYVAEVVEWLPSAPVTEPSEAGEIETLPADAIVSEPMALAEQVAFYDASVPPIASPEGVFTLPTDTIVYAPEAPPVFSSSDAPRVFDSTVTVGRAEISPAPGLAAAQASSASSRPTGGRRLLRKSHLFEVAIGCLVLGLGSYIGWMKWQEAKNLPTKRWEEIQDLFKTNRYTPAAKAFAEYKQGFPDSPHTENCDFFVKLCEAKAGIFSSTADLGKGQKALRAIFKEFRDTRAYEEYNFDLFQALQQLIDRLAVRATKKRKLADLTSAREALELVHTVCEKITDPSVLEDADRLGTNIEEADRKVRTDLAKIKIDELLTAAADPERKFNAQQLDSTYHRIEELLLEYPTLADDKKLRDRRRAAVGAEALRVRYVPSENAAAFERPAESDGARTIVVIWKGAGDEAGKPSPAAVAEQGGLPGVSDGSRQVMALANGVLYVFERSGDLLWSRRLGADSERLPSLVAATGSSVDAFIAASSEDRALLSLDAATGEALWKAPTPGVVAAPLTIVSTPATATQPAKRRGLLPTAGGAIHVYELVLGKRLGIYQVGQPLNVGGAFDSRSGLVFFPAEAQRVFAIDPAKIDQAQNADLAACRSVLFTGHASGALRSEPLVVDRYFVLIEAANLEEMRLKAFEISAGGFSNPEAEPLKMLSLPGWSWFPPQTSPDRATLVTDRGELGLFGFNLDNPREEAIYPLVVDGARQPSTRLPVDGDYRAAAIHAEEHLVWVLVGGKLQKLAIDVLHQQLKPMWAADTTPTLGIPIHESQAHGWDADLTLYLTTMSPDGRQCFASAVAGESGELLWQRQLGINPLVDPVTIGKETLIVDRSGRVLRLARVTAGRGSWDHRRFEPDDRGPPGDAATRGEPFVLSQNDRPSHLVARLDEGRRLAVRRLDGDDWQTIELSEPLQGGPCLLGNVLVAPCADGLLHRYAIDGTRLPGVNEDRFQWSQNPGPTQARLTELAENAVLLVDGAGKVRRLEFRTVDVLQRWEQIGHPFSIGGDLSGPPLLAGDRVLLVERSGNIHAIDAQNPGKPLCHWKLAGAPSGAAVLRGGRLLVVLDRKRLACIDPLSEQADPTIAWSVEFAGRIRGAPVLSDDVLVVTDDSRHITGLRLSDGKAAWATELPVQVGPSAAAVPVGKRQLLAPLRDGTLVTLPMPGRTDDLAEASP